MVGFLIFAYLFIGLVISLSLALTDLEKPVEERPDPTTLLLLVVAMTVLWLPGTLAEKLRQSREGVDK